MIKRFFGKKKEEVKTGSPELRVVPLHPYSKPQISSLGGRIDQIIDDYLDQEHEQGRMVTYAELVGTLELVKLRRAP